MLSLIIQQSLCTVATDGLNQSHSWLHYSPSEDGVYCKACTLFAPADVKRQKLGVLVHKPFSVWTKQSSVFSGHEQLTYHQDSMTRMAAVKDSCSNPVDNVATMINKAHEKQVTRNAQVIKSPLKCFLLWKTRPLFPGSQR